MTVVVDPTTGGTGGETGWLDELATVAGALDLPLDLPRPPRRRFTPVVVEAAVPGGLPAALEALTSSDELAPVDAETVLLATLAATLHRYTHETEFLLASPVPGRETAVTAARVPVDSEVSVVELLRAARSGRGRGQELGPIEVARLARLRHGQDGDEALPAYHAGLIADRRGLDDTIANWTAGAELTLAAALGGERLELVGNGELFTVETLSRMARHMGNLLAGMAADPLRRVGDLPLLDDDERRVMLVDWNATSDDEVDEGDERAFHEMVEQVAARTPAATAIVSADATLTFAELNTRANQLAHHLIALGVAPGSHVGLCLERSGASLVAQLAIFKAGAGAVLLDPAVPPARLAVMLENTAPAVLVTREELLAALPTEGCSMVCVDRDAAELTARPGSNPGVGVQDDYACHVPHTSGSTGLPKAVVLRHGALRTLVHSLRLIYDITAGSSGTWASAPGFAIVEMEAFPFLAAGAPVHVIPPEVTALPEVLRDWLVEREVTHALLITTLAEQVWALPWPHAVALRCLTIAGERLRTWPPEDLPFEILNVYGSAEATLVATCTLMATARTLTPQQRAARMPPIGRPAPNVRAYVLDARFNPVPPGVLGELFVAGSGLSLGYLNRPDVTSERYLPNPLAEEPSEVLYRTGDTARCWPDGVIEVVARTDDQVKIRGFRIELGEVESVLAQLPGVRQAVTLAREDVPGDKRLTAYVVPAAGAAPSIRVLRHELQERLPHYMVPSVFVLLGALPLLPNGKVHRAALPAPDESRPDIGVPYVEPRGDLQQALALLWSDLLRVETIGVADGFFELGGDSLLAVQLVTRVRDLLGVELSLPDFYAAPTIRRTAELVERSRAERQGTSSNGPDRLQHDAAGAGEPFPLTETQQALWIGRGDAVEFGNVGCHGYFEWERTGLDAGRFRRAWRRLVERHDMLRAIIRPDGLQQVLAVPPPYEIRVLDLRGQDPAEELAAVRAEMSHAVFQPERWPLFDVRITLLDGGRARLHLGIDLLVMDAWSAFQVLFPDLVQLYDDPEVALPTPGVTFRDYVLGARRALEGSEVYRRDREYWLSRLDDLPPAPDLPVVAEPDEPVRFGRREHHLDPRDWERLRTRASQSGITPSGILVAAFAEVLRGWSSNETFTINFPIFDRMPLHPDLDGLLGDFTNTLLVAVEKADGTFEERARALQRQLWEDLEHRRFNGVSVLRELARLHGGAMRAAMPIVVTSLLGQPPRRSVSELGREIYSISQTPQVLLDFQIREIDGVLVFNWDVLEAMFPARLIDAMFTAYCDLLDRLIADDDAWRQAAFPLVPEGQLAQRAAANDTAGPVPEVLLHDLLAEHARQRPSSPAVVAPGRRLTYGELHRLANQAGRCLRELGARPNRLVGIVMEKGWEQYVGVYGVLAAGSAYLPIDPAVPAERLQYLLDHGEVELVLTQSRLDESLSWPPGVRRVAVDRDLDAVSDAPLPSVQRETDLAYVIYTSGSTGRPKGVMVDHRGVANMAADINARFGIGPDDRAFAVSSLAFDASIYDVFGILAAGGTAVLPAPFAQPEPERWAQVLEREQVTFWNSVPVLMEIVVDALAGQRPAAFADLRTVILSGDWIPLNLPERIRACAPRAQVVSAGGPTETICWSIVYPVGKIDPGWRGIPYGRPIANQRYHVVDQRLRHRPDWVPGEMVVASDVGLAHGYWRDEARTSAQFVTLESTGERVYRTGDVGRYLPDGTIEILGRADFQVKIQGHRIELGEIETALGEHPAVRSVAVVAPESGHGTRRLAAFAVPRPGEALEPEQLRRFLGDRLPAAMLPAQLVLLDELPLSRNGKVDRLALLELARHGPAEGGGEDGQEPSALEHVVAGLCAELLGLDRVGVTDNFFTLGGDSLSGTRLAARIREIFDVGLPLRTLFTRPTVREVCADLLADETTCDRTTGVAEALVALSAGELERLLLDPELEEGATTEPHGTGG